MAGSINIFGLLRIQPLIHVRPCIVLPVLLDVERQLEGELIVTAAGIVGQCPEVVLDLVSQYDSIHCFSVERANAAIKLDVVGRHAVGNGHARTVAQFYVVDVVVALVGDVAVVHQIGLIAVDGVEPHRKRGEIFFVTLVQVKPDQSALLWVEQTGDLALLSCSEIGTDPLYIRFCIRCVFCHVFCVDVSIITWPNPNVIHKVLITIIVDGKGQVATGTDTAQA